MPQPTAPTDPELTAPSEGLRRGPGPSRTPPRVTRDRTPLPVVLLAEDDDELRRLLTTKLQRTGCLVFEARNGMELAQLIIDRGLAPPPTTRMSAEIIISDVRMPGLTGMEIVSLLRQVDWTLPVILITGFGDAATHAEADELGVLMLDKPVDLDHLVAITRASLGL